MDEELIKSAQLLYLDTLIRDPFTLSVSLDECYAYYCPKTEHSHRTYWTEENLFIFIPSNEESFDNNSACHFENWFSAGLNRKVYFFLIKRDANQEDELKKIFAFFLQLPEEYYSKITTPYYPIDCKKLSKIIELRAFI